MRSGIFKVTEPLPELKEAHVLAILKPWVDAGSVGTLVLERLEARFAAKEMARLAMPGTFYDFTRYRPVSHYEAGVRQLTIPNTTISVATPDAGNDFMFLHLLEPHCFGEYFTSSVWQFLRQMGVQRYILLGSFYDMVPHTRPILISGGSSRAKLKLDLQKMGISQSRYEGPTTICNLISQEAEKAGVETISLMVHLPNYVELEEDYAGMLAVLRVLHSLYDIPINDEDVRQAEVQQETIDTAVRQDKKLKGIIAQLEAQYDSRIVTETRENEPRLSPQVDQFLKDLENRYEE
jgi:hypothetical protein